MKIDISYNGKSLSREVPGFCLLSIEGRESQSRKVSSQKIPGRRGMDFHNAEYEAKTIKVKYKIIEPVNIRQGPLFNHLQSILYQEQSQLIFSDEPDKYWIATCTDITANTLTFYCADPVKYALVEKPFIMSGTGSSRKFIIENSGSVPVPIRYELKLRDETGYVGLTSALNAAMEFGDHDESSSVYDKRDEMVLDAAAFKRIGRMSDGSRHRINPDSRKRQDGGDHQFLDWYEQILSGWPSCGSGWCHSQMIFDVPKTSISTEVVDFEFKNQIWFECGDAAQIGEQIIEFVGEKNGRDFPIARLTFTKGTSQLSAEVIMYVGGQEQAPRVRFTPNSQSSYSQGTSGYLAIRRLGEEVSFFPEGPFRGYSFRIPEIGGVPLKKIQIYFGHQSGIAAVTRNYMRAFSLKALNVEGQFDVRNTFFPGDGVLSLTIDGASSKFYIDGRYEPAKEIIGSQWFSIPPGIWEVHVMFSKWFSGRAEGVAYIREGWL